MKRNFGIQASAIFVLIWYCLGIVGFNVHTCTSSNNSFIVTFLEDMTCDAIHPSENCGVAKSCCCCSSHSSELSEYSDYSIAAPECCTNDYQVLTAAADKVDENQRLNLHSAAYCTSVLYSYDSLKHESSLDISRLNGPPDSSQEKYGIRLLFGVWRI